MPPVISSISPSSGPVGSNVLISGTGFGATGVVKFGSTVATPSSYFGTQIIVPVPVGAVTSNITVTVSGQVSNGVLYTVTALAAPTIASITPNHGPIGLSVTIAGNNFGTMQGSSTVTFSGNFNPPPPLIRLFATVLSWSNTSIVVIVPSGAQVGNVIVTTSAGSSNAVTFTPQGPSNGGTGAPIGLLLIPAQQFNTQVVLGFDTTTFDDLDIGSFYSWKVEEIIAGRTPTCSRQIIQFRNLGVATITATLSGIDQNTQEPTSVSETFTIGTVSASGKIFSVVRGLALTAQNLQYTVTRGPGAGPVSIVKVQLEGRVEMTAYA
jgi:IPT/TIG domain